MGTARGATDRRRSAGAVAAFVVAVGASLLAAADFAVAGGADPETSTTVGPVLAGGQEQDEVEIGVDVERVDQPTPTTATPTTVATEVLGGETVRTIPGTGEGGAPTEVAGVVLTREPSTGSAAPADDLAVTGASSTLLLVAIGVLLIDLGYLAATAVPARLRDRLRGRTGLVVA